MAAHVRSRERLAAERAMHKVASSQELAGFDDAALEDLFSNVTDEELFVMFEDAKQKNEVLSKENIMFEKYLSRVEPQLGKAGSAPSEGPSAPFKEAANRRKSVQRKRNDASEERALKLLPEQKCDIASRELEEIRDEIERKQEDWEGVLDSYRASMEEAEIRLAELKKASYDFRRDIVQGAVNPRTEKVIAEKITRYFEDKMRQRDALIEKLRLKNSTLKVQKNKLHMQLKQKEEMGEVLHAIDFEQLKIENRQYLERIEERNEELLRLKLTAGNTLLVLNSYKKKLNVLTLESSRLKTEITQREDMQRRISSETIVVEEERSKAERINQTLRRQLDDYKVPQILQYVNEKAEQYDLTKRVSTWERKVEIAALSLRKHRKLWKEICSQTYTQHPWNALDSQAASAQLS